MGGPTRHDGRVESGQKISTAFSARAWNRAQDAADLVLSEQTRFGAASQPGNSAPYTWVYCKNKSGVACPRWGVLEIDGMEIVPADAGDAATVQFERMPVMAGVLPQGYAYGKSFVIAVEPIPSDGIGRATVAGVVQCKLNVTDEDDKTAHSTSGSTTELTTGNGDAEILWKQGGTGGGKWGLVRVGREGMEILLCKTEADIQYGALSQVQVWTETTDAPVPVEGKTVYAVNRLYGVAAGSWLWVAKHSVIGPYTGTNRWHIVAASDLYDGIYNGPQGATVCMKPTIGGRNLSELPGYSTAKKQALTHDNGCLAWIDLEDCPP